MVKPHYEPGIRVVKPPVYNKPEVGHFSVESKDHKLVWDKCREQFVSRFSEADQGLYFFGRPQENHKIAAFLTKTEQVLALSQHSTFSETDSPAVIWIMPCRFWMVCPLRRQLLTLLVRAGVNYDPEKDDYERALWFPDIMGKCYALETKPAVCRFLYGYTKMGVGVNASLGWWTIFRDRDIQSIKRMLVFPEEDMVEFGTLGINNIWG